MAKLLLVRYDVSQESAVPVMLRDDTRWERRVVDGVESCCTVHKDENGEVAGVCREVSDVVDGECFYVLTVNCTSDCSLSRRCGLDK